MTAGLGVAARPMAPPSLQDTSTQGWEGQHKTDGSGQPAAGAAPAGPLRATAPRNARRLFTEQLPPDAIQVAGVSAAIRGCIRQADIAAVADGPVLLYGETGTGKNLFARLVHERSRRHAGPFVAVECAGLSETLLESTIFGHERGAYTGADRRFHGSIETARGGTVLLDDVWALPMRLQAKLVRLLQDGEFQRLGGSISCRANVRILAASRRDLAAGVRLGAFRKDLFALLAASIIHLPPLRERPEDIALLAFYFLGRLHPAVERIDEASLAGAEDYAWPGNARELRNLIERAVILADGPVISLDVPRPGDPGLSPPPATTGAELAAQIRELKVRAIQNALAQTGGNRTRAARLLGLDPASLFRMARRLGLWPQAPA